MRRKARGTLHREAAWEILREYSLEERTRKHGIAVEAVMQAYARTLCLLYTSPSPRDS